MNNLYPNIEVQELVEALHSLICKKDLVQKCGLMFDNWEKPSFERMMLIVHADDLLSRGYSLEELSRFSYVSGLELP